MTKPERDQLAHRYLEMSDELTALAGARGGDGGPTPAELTLLAEQDEIERQLGVSSLERREA